MTQEIQVNGESTLFSMGCPGPPKGLIIDPDFDLLRRLDPGEIPPSVNLLKSSPSVLLVLPEGVGGPGESVARILTMALGLEDYRIVSERNLGADLFASRDIILVGLPGDRRWFPPLPELLVLEKDRFSVDGREYRDPSDVFFGVFRHPSGRNRVLAVFHALSVNSAELVARKVAHYGQYSYTTFKNGVNREKGWWPVENSPVAYEWKMEQDLLLRRKVSTDP
jgi:hypothetical protein